jgi:hypothetical protein
MSESEGKLITTTYAPTRTAPVDIRISGAGMNPDAPTIRVVKRKTPVVASRASTIRQRRMKKIRGLLRKCNGVRPEINTYIQLMTQGAIPAPLGLKTYSAGLKDKRARAVISAELSRAWRGL